MRAGKAVAYLFDNSWDFTPANNRQGYVSAPIFHVLLTSERQRAPAALSPGRRRGAARKGCRLGVGRAGAGEGGSACALQASTRRRMFHTHAHTDAH
jgi:hypothetical protein